MKKYSPSANPKLWQDSFVVAFFVFGGIQTIMSIMDYTLACITDDFLVRLMIAIIGYAILTVIVLCVKIYLARGKILLVIRGINVTIKQGDIFEAKGWKLIPFNEYFDTLVDDIVISRNSLNGKYIESLSETEKAEMRQAIEEDNRSPLKKYSQADGKTKYELGTIKTFHDTMMFALTHFNEQHEAHTDRAEYERTLRTMWKEIGRTYQGKSITLPLIGAGMTRLDDMPTKPNMELLKCILCTLRTSTVTFSSPITILLTEGALKTINLYELKGEK